MKGRNLAFIILFIVLVDQTLKIYIKTHFAISEQYNLLGNWSKLLFVENEGMAYGMSFGGEFGKIILTLFRLGAVIFGVWYLRNIVQKKYHTGFIICAGLIFAGALGNLIDSMFYGLIFEESTPMNVARIFPKHGYAGFLHGKVVDMLYFPIYVSETKLPDWIPFLGGDYFEFFRPVFNLADASISSGVIAILLFQRRFFKHHDNDQQPTTVETHAIVNDDVQVQ